MVCLARWIHVSDVHMGHGDAAHGFAQSLVLDELRADARKQFLRLSETDFRGVLRLAFITGDIAFSGGCRMPAVGGQQGEYELAERWIAALASELAIDTRSVFVVPGNHDVDRSGDIDPDVTAVLRRYREERRSLDDIAVSEGSRGILYGRQRKYLTFARKYGWTEQDESALCWRRSIEAPGGLTLRIVGMNTALLAADERDCGNLQLGAWQIASTLMDRGDHELCIALSHHPLQGGWLRDHDEMHAGRALRARAHLHLSGHVHEQDTLFAKSPMGVGSVLLSAGAVHNERYPGATPHGYSIGEVHCHGGTELAIRIFPRRWANQRHTFVDDSDNVIPGQRFAEFRLDMAPRSHPKPPFALLVEQGCRRGELIALRTGLNLIGRVEHAAFRFPADYTPRPSRLHASIVEADGVLYLRDDSAHGTFLNGERIATGTRVSIARDDTIRVADTVFRIVRLPGEATGTPQTAGNVLT